MRSFCTINRHGYAVQFSTFDPTLLGVASSEEFGFSGNGTLFILGISLNGTIHKIKDYHWENGLFDVCWSESDSNHILTASADGSLQIWALDVDTRPIATFPGHRNEVSSIDWKTCQFVPLILSASWDKTIKIWDANRSNCLTTFVGHSESIHGAKFSHGIPNIIASVSGDRTMKLWSTLSSSCLASIRVHDAEVLSCDWCKHNSNIIATSASDSLIRCWDIRNHRQPLFQIKGGEQAVKRIKFSPHFPYILASASFDYTTQIWELRQRDPIEVFQHHSGFVYGLDWNNHEIGELADCSWDSIVQVFTSKVLQNLKNKL